MQITNRKKVEGALIVCFVAAALWGEFVSPHLEDDGRKIAREAALQSITGEKPDSVQTCARYRDALAAGSNVAAWYFADCIAQSSADASSRRALQYAVLSLCTDTVVNGVSCLTKRNALKASDAEIEAAGTLDVRAVLNRFGLEDPAVLH